MRSRTAVVLGGGIGGVVAARRLRRLLAAEDRVVLIEREPTFRFMPSLLWVMEGTRSPKRITRDVRRLRRHGIEVLETEVQAIDPDTRTITTAAGTLRGDAVVVALGAVLAPEGLEGFADAAHNIYTLAGASAAGAALRSFSGGRVAVMVSSMPYRCPAAPYEAAFLAEAITRGRRGARPGDVDVDVYTPEPLPMPTAGPAVGEALVGMLAERGIGFHRGNAVTRVDAGSRTLHLADGATASYDLLLGIPPHRGPEVVRAAGLAGDSGYVPVEPETLATPTARIWAIGDVTALPIPGGKMLPKAGVFAEAEAQVVARRVADELSGKAPTATFDGEGACFVELGHGRAAFATGAFLAADGPDVRMRTPGRRWHLLKVAFEQTWLRRWI